MAAGLLAAPGVARAAPECSGGRVAIPAPGGWQYCAAAPGSMPTPRSAAPVTGPRPSNGANTCANPQSWNFDPINGTLPPGDWTYVPGDDRSSRNPGLWKYVTCAGDARNPTGGPGWVWVPTGTAPPGGAVPTPAQLAQQAYDQLEPSAPVVDFRPRHHPGGPEATLVGLKTFLWVVPASLQPARRRAAAGTNWAEVTATVASVTFDPGDGSAPVVCPAGGTPYDPALPYAQQTADCWHVYARPSATGPFLLRATVTWAATWAGSGGAGGVLPAVSVTTTVPIQVQEMQVVNHAAPRGWQ